MPRVWWVLQVLLLLAGCAQRERLNLASGTVYAPQQGRHTPSPAPGCVPVMINHLGRHGSRHVTSVAAASKLRETYERAQQQGMLTGPQARDFHKWMRTLLPSQEAHAGELTMLGAEQQRDIGRRMARAFPELAGKRVHVAATAKKRAQQSAEYFLAGFGARDVERDYHAQVCGDHVLRFFDQCPAYRPIEALKPDKPLAKEYLALPESRTSTRRVALHVTAPERFDTLDEAARDQWVTYLYKLCVIDTNISPEPAKRRFCSFFTDDDLARRSHVEDLAAFHRTGPAPDAPIVTRQACLLLNDFIASTNAQIAAGFTAPVQLRFAHAEDTIPFISLMGYYADDRPWQTARVSPMATNVQWVLYRCGSDYRVKVMHDEREMLHQAPACRGQVYCDWSEFEKYYAKWSCDETSWKKQCGCDNEDCGCVPDSD